MDAAFGMDQQVKMVQHIRNCMSILAKYLKFPCVVIIAHLQDPRGRIVASIRLLGLTKEAPMVSIPKIFGIVSCGVVLCAGLSHAAPASAADDMNAGQTDRKGSQRTGKGEQDRMKGNDTRAAETHRKGGQADMKGEEEKTKRVDNAGKPTEKKKEIGQNEMGK